MDREGRERERENEPNGLPETEDFCCKVQKICSHFKWCYPLSREESTSENLKHAQLPISLR